MSISASHFKLLLLTIILTLGIVSFQFFHYLFLPQTLKECDSKLWNHVNQKKLKIIDKCISVTGTVMSIKIEKDGNTHVRLKLDPQYSYLINSDNYSKERGALVLKLICQNPVLTEKAEEYCDGSTPKFPELLIGSKIKATGMYVQNRQYYWNAIHPVSRIEEL
jgi:hypothetical protein